MVMKMVVKKDDGDEDGGEGVMKEDSDEDSEEER